MGFGKEIKRLRELAHLSGRQMAEVIGIDKDRLKQWELKDFEPRAEDRSKIETFLGYPLEMLPKFQKFPDKVLKKIDEYLHTTTSSDKSIPPSKSKEISTSKNLIPFYDTVTIGGTQSVATMDAVTQPSEWIDVGDLFPGATGAMRHYNDSMNEYPSGCILAFKDVLDYDLVVPGRNYVIETSEYRITKKLAKGKDGYIIAHSTNKDTYPDGSIIHQPMIISLKKIRRLSLVLGKVENEGSSSAVRF